MQYTTKYYWVFRAYDDSWTLDKILSIWSNKIHQFPIRISCICNILRYALTAVSWPRAEQSAQRQQDGGHVTLGSCFPLPVRMKRGREKGGWFSERLDPDLLLSVSSLLTGRPKLGSKVTDTSQYTYYICNMYTQERTFTTLIHSSSILAEV